MIFIDNTLIFPVPALFTDHHRHTPSLVPLVDSISDLRALGRDFIHSHRYSET